ncbi:MAG: 16S rRNA (uracil(1498)-N(3))-methyltransferase, partial [Candidatus Hydrogenedentes bacterium]|nr:16S rRNA (uracil(1498)-N(3))-methyltransferase [Candidatus Hydrogenedentota bacterium]
MPHVHRFFIGPGHAPAPADGVGAGLVELPPQEAHHALHVVRIRPDDAVVLFDGCGRELAGRVAEADRRRVSVAVESERQIPPPALRLTLVQAGLHREKSVEELIRRGSEV